VAPGFELLGSFRRRNDGRDAEARPIDTDVLHDRTRPPHGARW
jgi:hypothetical protein